MQDNSQKYNRSFAVPVFIILFIASLALCAFLFFKYAKNAKKLQDQNEELVLLYSGLELDKDSIQGKLQEVERLLQERIDKNLAQSDLNADLRTQLEAKKNALRVAYSRISDLLNKDEGDISPTAVPRNLLQAKEAIVKLQQLNTAQLIKIEKLQKSYVDTRQSEEAALVRAASLLAQKDSLLLANDVVSKKMQAASILRVVNLRVTPIREQKGRQEIMEKARKVERLKCEFTVSASDFTYQEEKEIIIRIAAPNGSIITQDTRKLTDVEDLFTLKQILGYDGSEKRVTYYYQQVEEYAKGEYSAELRNSGIVLAKCSFRLL